MSSVQLGGVEGPIFFGPDLQLGLSADLEFRPRSRSHCRAVGPQISKNLIFFARKKKCNVKKYQKIEKMLKNISDFFVEKSGEKKSENFEKSFLGGAAGPHT